ncbi:MAG: protein kinase domain-containing protein, partial [Acidobacteriota bacterium]
MIADDLGGRTLGGRYDILARLGVGGMGAVYRARDRELDEIVALKVIRDELARDPAMVERFRSEVKLARRVTHHNVARTFELARADGLVFCTMELVDGESLTRRLARERRIPLGDAVAIACAVCDGLAAAHGADVIHRDIKPDNVLLARDGRVVLADFGIAAAGAAGRGEASGTPAYMAPEQARGEPATPATDVYAVGLVLLEMVTGRRAFEGGTTTILAAKQALEHVAAPGDELPGELAQVLARATARDRAMRLATASELRAQLAPWARGARLVTQAPERPTGDDGELATVVVLAPRGDDARLYLAEEVYDELLGRLMKRSHLRVLPRVAEGEPGALVARLEVGTNLVVHAERDGEPVLALDVPLAIDRVDAAADQIAAALTSRLALAPRGERDRKLEARDIMMQARHNIRRSLERANLAAEQIERAHVLDPEDPRILATRAMIDVRRAFFTNNEAEESLARAGDLARKAVAAAPELADAYLALGHVELHGGNPIAAAAHYRKAIARAPHSSEAHEYLGRMLLEAGYLEPAIARLQEAIAISPSRRSNEREHSSAAALEGNCGSYDRLVAGQTAARVDRTFARARCTSWRKDRALVRAHEADMMRAEQVFVPGLMIALIAVYRDEPWPPLRDRLLAIAHDRPPNRRRRTFVAQITAEAAGWAGDVDTCARVVELA